MAHTLNRIKKRVSCCLHHPFHGAFTLPLSSVPQWFFLTMSVELALFFQVTWLPEGYTGWLQRNQDWNLGLVPDCYERVSSPREQFYWLWKVRRALGKNVSNSTPQEENPRRKAPEARREGWCPSAGSAFSLDPLQTLLLSTRKKQRDASIRQHCVSLQKQPNVYLLMGTSVQDPGLGAVGNKKLRGHSLPQRGILWTKRIHAASNIHTFSKDLLSVRYFPGNVLGKQGWNHKACALVILPFYWRRMGINIYLP